MQPNGDEFKNPRGTSKAYKAGLVVRDDFNAYLTDIKNNGISEKENNAKAINKLLRKGIKKLGGEVINVPIGSEKLRSKKKSNRNNEYKVHPSALIYNNNKDKIFTIYIPEGDHPEVENWAISFELGHYYLHPNDQNWFMGGQEGIDSGFNDDAAAFSVAFLLPDDDVWIKYNELKKSIVEEEIIISKIADYFGVWQDFARRQVNKLKKTRLTKILH